MSVNNTMGDDGFYITLPCNSSRSVYPDNEISRYRTKLSKPFMLKGEWQVGLIEFQYPRTWETFPDADGTFDLFDKKSKQTTRCTLRTGFYPSITTIVDEINRLLAPHHVQFGYDDLLNKIYIQTRRDISVKFYGKLAIILGVNTDGVLNIAGHVEKNGRNQEKVYAPNPADIYGGFYTIFVYTDIIEHQVVGDYFVPLLRNVQITGKEGVIVTIKYDKVHYIPVSKNYISDIDIEVKTDQNYYVPFTYGKVVAKLHFRPVRHRLGF